TMSKFFAMEDSTSESESEDSRDSDSDFGGGARFEKGGRGQGKAGGYRAEDSEESGSEDEEKRVVKSQKEKKFGELTSIVKNLRNHKKINDVSNVLTDFEDRGVPNFYIKCIAELEDFTNEAWEGRKKMSKMAAKSLTTLRQKIRKYNRDFEEKITAFRANPEEFDEEEEPPAPQSAGGGDAGADRDLEDGADGGGFLAAKQAGGRRRGSQSDDSDEDWGGDSDESSSSSSSDEDYGGNLAAKFLKRPGKEEERAAKKKAKQDEKDRRKRDEAHRREERRREEEGEDKDWEKVDRGGLAKAQKVRLFEKGQEISFAAAVKKLEEIRKGRGKRGTDKTEQIGTLQEMEKIVLENGFGPGLQIKVIFDIVSAIFDYNPSIAVSMRAELWLQLLDNLDRLFDLLERHSSDIVIGASVPDDGEMLESAPYMIAECPLTQLERMDSEYTKILQNSDAHSTVYVERLQDERRVCSLIDRLVAYMEAKRDKQACSDIDLGRRLQPADPASVLQIRSGTGPSGFCNVTESQSMREMNRMCQLIYQGNQQRERTRAILYHTYFLALHDQWFRARDLMLMSSLQQHIEHSDIATQILYNRAMVQLGLCAFRKGQLKDAHMALVDIQSSGRAKELLAQGVIPARFERTPEQEKLEKRRQMPYHMHINLELLECVYLVSAMLLEIPSIAAHENDQRRRMISKNFHHVLKINERNTVNGPPESMREHVVAAAKAMRQGKWQETRAYIINDKMNAKVWNLFFQSENVKTMLESKIKEEAMRTYLFTFSSIYDTLSMSCLAEQFELELSQVHSVVSRMILHDEISASLDEPTRCIVMHKTEPTRLQQLSLQLTERLSSLVDMNEKIAEAKNISITSSGPRQFQGQQQANRGQYADRRQVRFQGQRGERSY
uniref:Eukaryotic translation initiation factor 3 subunit C n=1 Tax=Macrostomum lignano TaxID=282301 RepID=A0A1I8GZN5_9PLAT